MPTPLLRGGWVGSSKRRPTARDQAAPRCSAPRVGDTKLGARSRRPVPKGVHSKSVLTLPQEKELLKLQANSPF